MKEKIDYCLSQGASVTLVAIYNEQKIKCLILAYPIECTGHGNTVDEALEKAYQQYIENA